MTLLEISEAYRDSESAIRLRVLQLRELERRETDRERARSLQFRIDTLMPILREMRELAQLTAHYYDRGYFRNVKYTL